MRTLFVVAVAAVASGVSRQCTTDAECTNDEFCKQEVSHGGPTPCLETGVCVQRVDRPHSCSPPGTLPCYRVLCLQHLQCITLGDDRPGRCGPRDVLGPPRTCTPYTEALQCSAPLCYNPRLCICSRYRPPLQPCGDTCATAPQCDPGFVCKASDCGGCSFQCVRESECCQAAPTCRAGFEQTRAETCTQQMWDSGICVRESLCCKEIVCRTAV